MSERSISNRGILLVGAVLVASLAAVPYCSAQDSVTAALRRTISPGMTREQVTQRLGTPLAERHEAYHTYYFYDPGCGEPGCMPNDIVIFRGDSVEDAVFKSGIRTYTGAVGAPTVLPAIIKSRSATTRARPIQAAGDSTHRGGIVFVGPRPVGRPVSPYQTITPPASRTRDSSRTSNQ
jgi:hypothetical protein